MSSVSISGITKSYVRGAVVLPPLDLEIRDGELFFLLGPSGCGKSTLLRILAGLVAPEGGTVKFGERDVTNLSPEKRRAAMVFQNYALWPHLSVFENVAFGLRVAGLPRRDVAARANSALELVRMGDCGDRRVASLSGGQQQRVALARALAVEPEVLLLDEPLSNLDARLRDDMRGEIRRICKERHLTAVYVTHDRREALSMADRLAVMNCGKIIRLGGPEEVYNDPGSRFVASFLGDANFVEGEMSDNGFAFRRGGEIFAVRPEWLCFVPEGTPGAVEGKVAGRVFFGDRCEWSIESDAGFLSISGGSFSEHVSGMRCFVAASRAVRVKE